MTTYISVFIAAWAAGYVLGYQVWAIRAAVNAAS